MEILIAVIIIILLLVYVIQPEYGLGCIRRIFIPILLFTWFGPIGLGVYIIYLLIVPKKHD